MRSLDTTRTYRMPWTFNDNVLSWLEPTKRCNLYCEGCYSANEKGSDKSLAQIRADMDVFLANRRFDSVSLAGGDPLMHPDIVEIVRIISKEYGKKTVLNTNAGLLTPELTRELRRAGLFGFTFHIDSSQHRPGWKGKRETELNQLRLKYAEMAAAEGLSAFFNSTVFPHTLDETPAIVDWAARHIDIVHGVILILFRTSRTQHFDYFAQGKPVEPSRLVYYDEDKNPEPLTADKLVAKLRESSPDFAPAGYLGGTKDPQTFKWLVAMRVGDRSRIEGYVGPRFMEAVQVGTHLLSGHYLAYSPPAALGWGRPVMLAMSAIDPGSRRIAARYARSLLTSPGRLAAPLRMQTIGIIQPIDFLPSGEMNMCDGCPDITVHEGELVWSCRLDERKKFGCFLTAAPCSAAAREASGAAAAQS